MPVQNKTTEASVRDMRRTHMYRSSLPSKRLTNSNIAVIDVIISCSTNCKLDCKTVN